MREDTSVWPTLQRLSACLCAEMEDGRTDDDPELCFCGILPGETPIADYAGSGTMAWVRLVSSYPTTTFPEPDAEARCSTYWAHDIEVGVLECIPAFLDSRGALPTDVDQFEYAGRQMAYAAAMRRAVSCCLEKSGVDQDYRITGYAPQGPQGGVYGGILSITVLGA